MQIPLNKSKIVVMLFGSLLFVAIGLWFIISPPAIHNPVLGNRVVLAIVGSASVLFFGFSAVSFLRRMSDTTPGLVIDENGITDNSSAVAAGFIPWTDIEKISVIEIHRQEIIMVFVKDPQHYIDRAKNVFKRKLMKANFNMYGSPVNISANSLQVSHSELVTALMKGKELH